MKSSNIEWELHDHRSFKHHFAVPAAAVFVLARDEAFVDGIVEPNPPISATTSNQLIRSELVNVSLYA
jgi:hypothetical protein